MGHAILERVLLFGTRSADYIRASGHNGCIAAPPSYYRDHDAFPDVSNADFIRQIPRVVVRWTKLAKQVPLA